MAPPIRNLQTPALAEINKRGFLYQASLTLSSQSPSLFLFLEIPYHFRRLLRGLKEKDNGNKTTRLKSALGIFLIWGRVQCDESHRGMF